MAESINKKDGPHARGLEEKKTHPDISKYTNILPAGWMSKSHKQTEIHPF